MFEEKYLTVIIGETDSSESRVYVEYQGKVPEDHTLTISGDVIGPISDITSTLPSPIPLRNMESSKRPIAESIVPHPCAWTPETALLYGAEIKVQYNEQTFHIKKLLGIRPFGILDNEILWDYKPWYIEAIRLDKFDDDLLKAFHEKQFTLAVSNLDEDLLLRASTYGAAIIWTPVSGSVTEEELRRFANYPALTLIVISAATSAADLTRFKAIARNTLFAADGEADNIENSGFDLLVSNAKSIKSEKEADNKIPSLIWVEDDTELTFENTKERLDHWFREFDKQKPNGVILQPSRFH